MDGRDFDGAHERVAGLLDELAAMTTREQAAYIARAFANGAFQNDPLPDALRGKVLDAIAELAEGTDLDPDSLAVEAFRLHGYRAEMPMVDELVMLRAVRVQS